MVTCSRTILGLALAWTTCAFPFAATAQVNGSPVNLNNSALKVIMIKVCGMATIKDADGNDVDLVQSLGNDMAAEQKITGQSMEEIKNEILKSAEDQNTLNQQMGIDFCTQMRLAQQLFQLKPKD